MIPRGPSVLCLTLTLALVIASGVPAQAPSASVRRADLILTGGKVFTADTAHPWAQAVAVSGSRIAAVGTNEEIGRLAGPRTRRVALDGRVVIPGFNDAHDHLGEPEFGASFGAAAGPLVDDDRAQVLDSLRALAARTPAGTWLRGPVGLRFVADTAPLRAALDAVAPNHPVLLWGWTGHEMFVNTAGLRKLGITDDVRDPIGGHYFRDGHGHLSGRFDDYAEWGVLRRFYSAMPDPVLIHGLRRYASEALRNGVTSVQDMNGYLDPATIERVFRRARLPLRVRIIPYPIPDAHSLRAREFDGVPRRLTALTTVSGVKWILDGTPIEHGSFMREPYADRPESRGALQFPVDTIRAILARALATRAPLHLHVTGDSTPRLVFALMRELAPDSMWRPLCVRFEHGDWVSADLLRTARQLGVVIVQNPSHMMLDPAMVRARFGRVPDEFQTAREGLANGVPLAFGSDGAPRSPFVQLMFAITSPLHPAEAFTREEAVTAYTRGSAYAEFAEREKGTLAPGMLADLAVLSQDIFSVSAAALPATTSVLTMVGGVVAFNALHDR
ncbi:MAG TPA: amidohydrolase [Gemmatimonadaceae bacterium]